MDKRPPPLTGVLVTKEGATVYLEDGLLHREDGPAVTHADGRKENWIRGVFQPCLGVSVKTAENFVSIHGLCLGDRLWKRLMDQRDQLPRADREALEQVTLPCVEVSFGGWPSGSLMAWISNETRAAAACRAVQVLNPKAPPLVSPKRSDLAPRTPPSPMDPLPPPAGRPLPPPAHQPPCEAGGNMSIEEIVTRLASMRIPLGFAQVKRHVLETCVMRLIFNHGLSEVTSFAEKDHYGVFCKGSLVAWGRANEERSSVLRDCLAYLMEKADSGSVDKRVD